MFFQTGLKCQTITTKLTLFNIKMVSIVNCQNLDAVLVLVTIFNNHVYFVQIFGWALSSSFRLTGWKLSLAGSRLTDCVT